MSSFGDKLKKLRQSRGLSQKKLGDILNVSQNAIYSWESGRCDINFEMIRKIASYFDVSISYFLDDVVKSPGHEEPYYLDDDTREMVEFLHNNPDYKVLFDASRNVKKEDIDFVKQMMDRLRGDNHGDDTGC